MGETTDKQKVVVVGAGPVGALAALYAAGRGDRVEVYELRSDLRDPSTTPLNFTKSINLALSERGINSLRQSRCNGLLDDVLAETIPMYGRMIHARRKDGKLCEESQEYDIHGRYIRAADRAALNKRLLDALEKLPNVTLYFNHKLTGANFDNQTAWFERHQTTSMWSPSARASEISVTFDLLIGADGAHSAARYHMMKYARVDYHQEYIDTLWCEFRIQPTILGSETDFALSPNHLHIWPGGSFMFIAIPSLDESFTCTLFAPSEYFAHMVKNPDQNLLPFFQNNFPGVCPELISPSDLQSQFITNPHLPLISIKCNPHHYGSSVVILGDAAHAMVPFYGQGMNAGLEDVRVLFDYLDGYGVYDPARPDPKSRREARSEALQAYNSQRIPDAFAINNLALRNYQEMRSGVTSPLYRVRKWVEERVSIYLPILGWETQYSRVSFENGRYSEVEKAVERQGRILAGTLGIVVFGMLSIGGLWLWHHGRPARRWFSQWLYWAVK